VARCSRHGAQADPTSGSWLTAADSCTSQVRSQIRCNWILRDNVRVLPVACQHLLPYSRPS
jgi:hypothetical protein